MTNRTEPTETILIVESTSMPEHLKPRPVGKVRNTQDESGLTNGFTYSHSVPVENDIFAKDIHNVVKNPLGNLSK